jgi:hypothetical protein
MGELISAGHQTKKRQGTNMLSTAKTLETYQLDNLDGKIGKIKEFYFDDRHWAIRYLVAETGNWLADRQVLISPYAVVAVVKSQHHIITHLTKKQIEASPSLDSNKPVSRQFENAYYDHYEWPVYWDGPYSWGPYAYPERDRNQGENSAPDGKRWDPHLRSTFAVSGHHIEALDGEIGHIEDFIIDEETWAIRYLIVDTHNWWPGKKVLVSPQWVERVSWDERKAFVNLSREAIKHSPEYVGEQGLTRDYETKLHQHYQRQGYWIDELASA